MRNRWWVVAGVFVVSLISGILADPPISPTLGMTVSLDSLTPQRIAVGTSTIVEFKATLDAGTATRTEAAKNSATYQWWVYCTYFDANGVAGATKTFTSSNNSPTLDFAYLSSACGEWRICAECYVTAKIENTDVSADGMSPNAVIKVIGIDHVQVDSPQGDIAINTSVQLHAYPTPAGETFPDGLPTWKLQGYPAGADVPTNLIGENPSYAPTKAGKYTFWVACGSSIKLLEFVVVGYQPPNFPPNPEDPPNSSGSKGAISLSADPGMVKAGDTTNLKATVTDLDGAPVAGVEVTFTPGEKRTTDNEGHASLTSAALQQTTTFTASAPGYGYDTRTVTVAAGNSPTISLVATPSTIKRGGSSTLKATVKDGNGNLLSGVQVMITHGGVTDGTPTTGDGQNGSALGIAILTPVSPTVTTLYTATANNVSDTARVTVQIPSDSLQVIDQIWGGTKVDSDDDQTNPSDPLVAGPKTLGVDADQQAHVRIALAASGTEQFPWKLHPRATTQPSGDPIATGTFTSAQSDTQQTLVPGKYIAVVSKTGDTAFDRRVSIDVPCVDIQACPTTQPVGEDKEEDPGVPLSNSGTKVIVKSTGITGADGGVIYPRQVRWDNPEKVIVERMSNGQDWRVYLGHA